MPQVFVSHSAKDRDLVEREIITPLRLHGVGTWYSTDNIKSAVEWEKQIRLGLEKCDWFLVVLSPKSVVSDWVQGEVDWALEHRKGKVITVLIEDCKPSDLHLLLRRIQYIDFRSDVKVGQQKLLSIWGLDAATQVVNRYQIAQRAIQEKNWQVALGHLEEVLRLDPTHSHAKSEFERAHKIIECHLIAQRASATEEWASAISNYEVILRLDPTNDVAKTGLDHARHQETLAREYSVGIAFMNAGRFAEALKTFRLVRRLDRGYRDIAERIADMDAEVNRGDRDGTETQVEAAEVKPSERIQPSEITTPSSEIQPLSVIDRSQRLVIRVKDRSSRYLSMRSVVIASVVIIATLASLPLLWVVLNWIRNPVGPGHSTNNRNSVGQNAPSYEELSRSGDDLFNAKNYAEAEQKYEQALKQNANANSIQLKLGKALVEQKKDAKALEVLKKALQVLPNNADAYYYYGRALVLGKQYVEGENQIRQAIQLDGNNADYYYYLGVALTWQSNKLVETKTAYEEALKIDPNHQKARQELDKVVQVLKRTK